MGCDQTCRHDCPHYGNIPLFKIKADELHIQLHLGDPREQVFLSFDPSMVTISFQMRSNTPFGEYG